jgi:hypothetical protein
MALTLVTVAACARRETPARAGRAEIELRVLPDGSMTVREQLVDLRPVGASGAWTFTRHVSTEAVDELRFVRAWLDGQPLETSDPRLDARSGRTLEVGWRLPDELPHMVALEYRARGVVGVELQRGRLHWPVLPASRTWAVDGARVTLSLPPGSGIFRDTGIGEAGWIVARAQGGITATRAAVGTAPATVLADFSIDPAVIARPDWQVTLDLRKEFALSFVSGALFMLVIGAGVVWIVRFQHPRIRIRSDETVQTSADLPAALAALVSLGPRRVARNGLLATVLELKRSGLIAIDGDGRITALGAQPAPWRHQQVVFDGVTDRRATAAASRTHGFTQSRARSYARALMDDATSAGLTDPERLAAASGLVTAAWVSAIFTIACAVIAQIFLSRFSWWPHLITGSMLLVCAVFYVMGRRFRVWTRAGEHASRQWADRLRTLATGAPRSVDEVTRDLPLAVAAGHARAWRTRYGATLDAGTRAVLEGGLKPEA